MNKETGLLRFSPETRIHAILKDVINSDGSRKIILFSFADDPKRALVHASWGPVRLWLVREVKDARADTELYKRMAQQLKEGCESKRVFCQSIGQFIGIAREVMDGKEGQNDWLLSAIDRLLSPT